MMRTIFTLLSLVGAGAIFFLYTQPTYDQAQAVNAQISTYDAALQKAMELQQLKQNLLARYNAFNPNDIEKLQKLLPDHVDNVRLILDFDSIASKHGMALQDVVVSTPVVADASQSAASSITSSKKKYDSITLKFTTQGTYDQFKQFLTDIQNSLRIVDIASLKIGDAPAVAGVATGKAGAQTNIQPAYTYDITVRTYWLK